MLGCPSSGKRPAMFPDAAKTAAAHVLETHELAHRLCAQGALPCPVLSFPDPTSPTLPCRGRAYLKLLEVVVRSAALRWRTPRFGRRKQTRSYHGPQGERLYEIYEKRRHKRSAKHAATSGAQSGCHAAHTRPCCPSHRPTENV